MKDWTTENYSEWDVESTFVAGLTQLWSKPVANIVNPGGLSQQ